MRRPASRRWSTLADSTPAYSIKRLKHASTSRTLPPTCPSRSPAPAPAIDKAVAARRMPSRRKHTAAHATGFRIAGDCAVQPPCRRAPLFSAAAVVQAEPHVLTQLARPPSGAIRKRLPHRSSAPRREPTSSGSRPLARSPRTSCGSPPLGVARAVVRPRDCESRLRPHQRGRQRFRIQIGSITGDKASAGCWYGRQASVIRPLGWLGRETGSCRPFRQRTLARLQQAPAAGRAGKQTSCVNPRGC